MRIPAKLREELGEGYTITRGPGGCLNVFTAAQMDGLKKLFATINPFNVNEMNTARFFLANSWDAEEDKQGRILIPENLRKYANLTRNVIVFSGPTCIEIWDEDTFNRTFGPAEMDFEALAKVYDNLKNNA